MIFVLRNPLPWVEIAHAGVFDGLVGVSCVAATHSALWSKDRNSGLWLALGILLKYIPIAIVPFLAFGQRGFRTVLFLWFAAPVILGLTLSYLYWGPSTFSPLFFAATRRSSASIYDFVARANLLLDQIGCPTRLCWHAPDVSRFVVPCVVTALLLTFAWCRVHKITGVLPPVMSLLALTLFYWVGFPQYQVALFCSASYWMVIEWRAIEKDRMLVILLVSYFGSVGVMAFVTDTHLVYNELHFGNATRTGFASVVYLLLLLRFTSGVALLVALMRFSIDNKPRSNSICHEQGDRNRRRIEQPPYRLTMGAPPDGIG
jgi:hypothetical protein